MIFIDSPELFPLLFSTIEMLSQMKRTYYRISIQIEDKNKKEIR